MSLNAPNSTSLSLAASSAAAQGRPVEIERGNARTAIGDPQQAIVLGYDAQWPAIPPQALSQELVCRALRSAHLVEPATVGDGNRFAGRSIRAAAVLIALRESQGKWLVVLTQRASTLRDHAGQIAFPGGACDAQDLDAWATAQREAREEIGLPPEHLTLLGQLPTYTTVTAFAVTACVALLGADIDFKPNAQEVAETFEVPLAHLMNPAHHQRRSVQTPVGERTFYAIPSLDTQGKPRFIWGATAGMLRNLYRVLAFELKLQMSE